MASMMAIALLLMRVLCLIFLLISLIILATDFQYDPESEGTVHFKQFNSYVCMMCTSVIGVGYTLVQIPFAVHHVSSGKRLVDHDGLLVFEFYGDKVISALLAMGMGAGFGATSDLECLSSYNVPNFFRMANVSAAFLLMAFLCIATSSILSSFALPNNQQNNINPTTTHQTGVTN